MLQYLEVWFYFLKQSLWERAVSVFDSIEALRFLTSDQALGAIVILTALLMPVVQIWLRRREAGKVLTAIAGIAPVFFLMTLLMVPSGFVGNPDDNCGKYASGKLPYTLITYSKVLKDKTKRYGDQWLILVVKSQERWGDETHQCRLDLSESKTKALREFLENTESSGGDGRGDITFTIGGRNEQPNVRIHPRDPDGKISPPEVDERNKHAI